MAGARSLLGLARILVEQRFSEGTGKRRESLPLPAIVPQGKIEPTFRTLREEIEHFSKSV